MNRLLKVGKIFIKKKSPEFSRLLVILSQRRHWFEAVFQNCFS